MFRLSSSLIRTINLVPGIHRRAYRQPQRKCIIEFGADTVYKAEILEKITKKKQRNVNSPAEAAKPWTRLIAKAEHFFVKKLSQNTRDTLKLLVTLLSFVAFIEYSIKRNEDSIAETNNRFKRELKENQELLEKQRPKDFETITKPFIEPLVRSDANLLNVNSTFAD